MSLISSRGWLTTNGKGKMSFIEIVSTQLLSSQTIMF